MISAGSSHFLMRHLGGVRGRTKHFRVNVFLALIFFACFSSSLGAVPLKSLDKKIDKNQEELKKLKTRMEDLKKEGEKSQQEEKELSSKIKKLESEIKKSTIRKKEIGAKINDAAFRIKKFEKKTLVFKEEKEKWEEFLLADLRNMHITMVYPQRLKMRPLENWALKASVNRSNLNMQNAEKERDLSLKTQKKIAVEKTNLSLLEKKVALQIEKQKELKIEKSKIVLSKKERRIALEKEREQLEENSIALEKLIFDLIKKKERSLAEKKEDENLKKSFIGKKGFLNWPAEGRVVSPFGRQRDKELDVLIINNGIKINTASSTLVRAIEKGKVIFASNFRSYGKTVVIDHGGEFYSIYGTLGEILVKEGNRVSVGEIVGKAFRYANSQIYFELRSHGEAQDPLLWLKPR
ncbi:MAG: peptidoglycan DD-metalloendopeptidase family protein [Elusimicrobia bacterium]|nr:peptidoglycan DD-metalloendopeptidase family protein [Elusimicrobiota bacterium]